MAEKYHQQVWLRQLDHPVSGEMEDAVLRTIARLNGTPFPSTARLASRWLGGRLPFKKRDTDDVALETAYCAEIVAITYDVMGLLPHGPQPSWYDAGRFWSRDKLGLAEGAEFDWRDHRAHSRRRHPGRSLTFSRPGNRVAPLRTLGTV